MNSPPKKRARERTAPGSYCLRGLSGNRKRVENANEPPVKKQGPSTLVERTHNGEGTLQSRIINKQ